MSKFIEDFLDEQLTDEQFTQFFKKRSTDGDKFKIFADGLMIMETDRMIFKFLNSMAAKLLQEERQRISVLLLGQTENENIVD